MTVGRPSVRTPRIEMVPLIDSFFLLLAFFLSSALSMSALAGLPVELPRAAHAETLDPRETRVLTVSRGGQLQLDGQPLARSELAGRLQSDPRGPRLRVAVRVDQAVPAGELLDVLGLVRGAGVPRVGLLVLRLD